MHFTKTEKTKSLPRQQQYIINCTKAVYFSKTPQNDICEMETKQQQKKLLKKKYLNVIVLCYLNLIKLDFLMYPQQ